MSAAVAARQQQQSGSAAHGGSSNSNSRMGTSSPVDSKRANVKNEGMLLMLPVNEIYFGFYV